MDALELYRILLCEILDAVLQTHTHTLTQKGVALMSDSNPKGLVHPKVNILEQDPNLYLLLKTATCSYLLLDLS